MFIVGGIGLPDGEHDMQNSQFPIRFRHNSAGRLHGTSPTSRGTIGLAFDEKTKVLVQDGV